MVKFLMNAERLNRAIKLMNPETKKHVVETIRKGTEKVAQGAILRAPKRSGELRSSIRDEYSKSGLTGFVKAGYGKLQRRSRSVKAERVARLKARRRAEKARNSRQALKQIELGVYAPVIERGDPRRNKPPQPFLIPSLRSERPTIERGITQAMNSGMQKAAETSR